MHTHAPLITCVYVKWGYKRFSRFKDMDGSFPFDARFRPNRLAFKQREEVQFRHNKPNNKSSQRESMSTHNQLDTAANMGVGRLFILSGERRVFYN